MKRLQLLAMRSGSIGFFFSCREDVLPQTLPRRHDGQPRQVQDTLPLIPPKLWTPWVSSRAGAGFTEAEHRQPGIGLTCVCLLLCRQRWKLQAGRVGCLRCNCRLQGHRDV